MVIHLHSKKKYDLRIFAFIILQIFILKLYVLYEHYLIENKYKETRINKYEC